MSFFPNKQLIAHPWKWDMNVFWVFNIWSIFYPWHCCVVCNIIFFLSIWQLNTNAATVSYLAQGLEWCLVRQSTIEHFPDEDTQPPHVRRPSIGWPPSRVACLLRRVVSLQCCKYFDRRDGIVPLGGVHIVHPTQLPLPGTVHKHWR